MKYCRLRFEILGKQVHFEQMLGKCANFLNFESRNFHNTEETKENFAILYTEELSTSTYSKLYYNDIL